MKSNLELTNYNFLNHLFKVLRQLLYTRNRGKQDRHYGPHGAFSWVTRKNMLPFKVVPHYPHFRYIKLV